MVKSWARVKTNPQRVGSIPTTLTLKKESNMTKLTLIKSKPLDEQITDDFNTIELPTFDIIEHEDETWFTEMIEELNDMIKKDKEFYGNNSDY